jgi:hypothetical protein
MEWPEARKIVAVASSDVMKIAHDERIKPLIARFVTRYLFSSGAEPLRRQYRVHIRDLAQA